MSRARTARSVLPLALALLPLMVACGPGSITAQASQEPCQDIDLDDPPETDLSSESDANAVTVTRSPVFMDCAADFDPTVEPDGSTLRVYEAWEGEAGDCCFALTLGLKADNSGAEIDVEWFAPDDDTTPAHTLTVTTP